MVDLPHDIVRQIEEKEGRITSMRPIGGGCINHGACLGINDHEYFVKWNKAASLPGMFQAEAKGLGILEATGCIRIPEVVCVLEEEVHAGLLLEYITPGRGKTDSSEKLGRQLACLHKNKSQKFGLDSDNYMGSLPQKNGYYDSLIEFFIQDRLAPQLSLALANGAVEHSDLEDFEWLYARLEELLVEEEPTLIHGDLWNGNYMFDEYGQPVLIDPAISYGHREMDMAMTTLFGGFEESFYQAYQEDYPLKAGYRERFDIYNLYPLLVHVNLFGGGYLGQVRSILRHLIG
jgi:fructosamine-3-kinase